MLYINHGKEVYMANILPETEVRGSLHGQLACYLAALGSWRS